MLQFPLLDKIQKDMRYIGCRWNWVNTVQMYKNGKQWMLLLVGAILKDMRYTLILRSDLPQ